MKYFKLENLITCEEDRYDFADNYFTLYNNINSKNNDVTNKNNNVTNKNNNESTEKNINNNVDFECKLCKYMTTNLSNYKRHCTSNNHLTIEKIKNFCVLCNTNFNNIKSYNTHKYTYHKNKKSTDKNINNTIIDNNNN
jgi:hypothetical protein